MLLSSCTLAQQDNGSNENPSTCLSTSRFKVNKKYIYQYITESSNGVVGTANLKNGPKVTCQVEIEVPQTCGFIMRTMECTLSEVVAMDHQGQPVYKQSNGSWAFQAAMARNPLKFSVQQTTSVQLYPESTEPVNILNVKRGIISALIVPAMDEEETSLLSTLHGQCLTEILVNKKKDIAVDVTLSRDLSQCDQFYSRKLANSPLALVQNLHRPLTKLITSKQECNYHFDNKGKHIITAMCKEKHIYLPFSNRDDGILSVVTQELRFQSCKRMNKRVFDVDPSHKKPLYFEEPEDKSPFQTKDAALSTLSDLQSLTGSDHGQKRTSLFHKLVSTLRNLRNETLSQTVSEMLRLSTWFTWQALLQCGTPECTSAILQAIRTLDGLALEVDALVYVLSLQANPDAARVGDMLSMTQYKQSKIIMYALGNTVKKFHQGKKTPEVTAVSEFMRTLLNDCSGEMNDDFNNLPPDPEAMSFLVLRVVGVMGQAMQTVSPDLISSIMKCVKRSDISLSNKKAAIQAFRQMDINDEIKHFLKEVYQDPLGDVEIRIAAYLILMKNPDQAIVTDIVNNIEAMKDDQLKNFVFSHLKNIQKSNEPQMHWYREYIELALQDRLLTTNEVIDGKSRNYKIESPVGAVWGNIIFDATDTLPKEVMLETTLKVFNYNYDIFEFSVEGRGLEPTVEALFGENGFFPDSISRVMYWAGDQAQMIKEVLHRMAPKTDRIKKQASQALLNDIAKTIRKLMKDVRSSPTPEATVYLKLLGNEMYVKTSEIRKMAENLFMYFSVFFQVLPPQIFFEFTSRTDNEFFIHYIFMENSFSLSTALGFPLKFSLAGVFAPGAKGGMTVYSNTGHLAFMPSIGLEFITQMGVHAPDYVEAGIEMHTNMYHEHSLNTKVTINKRQIRLSIPAPKSNTQLFTFSNKLVSVSSGQAMTIPFLVVDRTNSTDCHPLFSGLKICTLFHYSNASSRDQAPYFPLTSETMAAVLIQPTEEVTEYTATIKRETLKEGKNDRYEIDSLRLTLKAEGDDSTEATASLKYNCNKNILTTEVVIPKYDVELGIRMAGVDSDANQNNMRGITLEVTSKNIPQLTLVGRTRIELMKNAMLQLQMVIPALKTNALFTATLKKHEDIMMIIETMIKLPETSYQQTASLKYDKERFEVQLKSDLNSEICQILPNMEYHHRRLEKLIDNILDQKVAKTDMKLRHIVTKGIEAGNIWLDKLTVSIPILKIMQNRRLSELIVPSLPDRIFLQFDNLFRYKFNKDKMEFSLPLPLGGKKLEELNFHNSLSVPTLDLPAISLQVPAKIYRLPSFIVPPAVDFTVPLLGLAEAFIKIDSNLYSLQGSISGGNYTVDSPRYTVQYKAITKSPFDLLIYNLEGTAMMSGRPDDHLECLVNHSFNHSLIQTSLSVSETLDVTNKRHAKANYKIEASGPLGFHASFYYVAQSTSTIDSDEVTGDGTWDGTLKIGSFFTNTSYRNSYNLYPQERKGRGESILRFDSPFVQIHNTIHGVYANFELNVVSKTNVQKDIFNHVSELNYKDSQLTLKCTGVAKIGGKLLRNKVEFGVSYLMVIINAELMADDETNQAYYLITGTLNSRGLKVNSDGSLTFDEGRGFHKASIVVDRNGLTTGGTNRIQYIPVTFENIFSGSIDSNGASLSSMTKAMAKEGYVELNIEGKITAKESSFYGVFNGNVFNAHTRNNVNYVLNRRAFTFISTSMVKMGQMKTENSHTLALTLWTVALHSKTGYFLCEDTYYKQDTKIDMKPFVMTFDAKTEVKLFDLSLNKVSHIKLEPVKVYLSGSTDGAYREEDSIKHTYEINYQAMSGKIKSNTSGNLLGINLCQTCELEFAGLSSASFCQSEINSKPLHFDSIIRTQALPFSLSVDALFNSDGEIILYGMHSGQLYSQLQFKAEPLVLVCSHDSRMLTMHALSNWKMSTQLDHKFDGFLMPNDQALTWKIKSKLHSHSYDQNISGYNNPQKAGFEFSGVMLTDAFHGLNMNIGSIEEMQEFSIGGFLKYDKSSSNIIAIPFPFLAAFEELKNTCINALETLQRYINNLDINQMISDFRVKLDQLPSQVNDFIKEMDLENKVNQIKEKVDYFINGFDVTMDDLEVMMSNLKKDCENKVLEIATKIRNLILSVNDYLKSRQISEKLIHVLAVAENKLHVFNEKYNIKVLLLEALQAIENIVENVDLVKFTDSSIDWLQELDSNYGVREKIKKILADMKDKIESFDVKILFQQMNMFLLSTNMGIEKLLYEIPYTDIANVMESINDVLVNWIDEYEIPNKLNAIYSYIRDHILKYDLDDIFKEIIDQAAILIKKIKIEETVHSIVNAVNVLNFELIHDQMLQFIYSVKKYLRLIDLNKRIEELNKDISSAIQSLNDFDYNSFVNKANKKIAEVTNCINERIKKYEIVFKFEAVREFIRKIQSIIFHYIEKLKNTRVADSLKKLKDVIDSTFYIDIKMKVQDIIEDIRQRIFEMDIREEMYFYLQRASESYSNISAKVNRLIVEISKLVNDSEILCQIKQTIDDGLNELNNTEIQVYSFTVLFTDLVIPRFTINMNKLHEITIPAEISVPEFNIIGSVTVPAFTISFDELKAKILAMIDYIKGFEMPAIDLDGIFGDLKVLYIFSLPDVTFPEITLSEIKVPTINMPKLHIKDFDVMPGIKRPDIAHENCVQVFGKFQGEFKVNFPVYTLGTTGMIEHSTSSPQSPKFKATIHSHAKSTIQIMEYTFDAMAQLEAPGLKELKFTEIIKVSHSAFSIEHDASLVIMGSLAEVSAQTVSKATTSMYTADLVNSMTLSLRIGISVTTTTSYNHNFNITSMEISSQTSVKHYMASTVDRGITWSSKTTAYGKWSWENYSDEGTHESTLEFNTNFNTTKLTFLGDIDCTALKVKPILKLESLTFSHIVVDARCELEASFMKSVIGANGEANIWDLKVALTAYHDSQLSGCVTGSIYNTMEFMSHSFETVYDVKNKVTINMVFPLKLTGKVDLQYDYGTKLNSEKQQIYWTGLARFNQYKYNYSIGAEHNYNNVTFNLQAYGEANVDFLTVPFSVPLMNVPFLGITTPEVKNLSLWEHAGLKTLLTTPQQSFDAHLKFTY